MAGRGGALLLVLALAASVPARGEGPLDAVRLRAVTDRPGARAALDSLLASGTLSPDAVLEGEGLRASLEEDGTRYEARLRGLLDRGLPSASEASVHLALGRIAFARGDLSIALEEFRRAREKGLGDEGSLWEGITAFALGDGEAARSALSRVSDGAAPALRERALLVLGDTYRVGESWSEARSIYRRLRETGGEGGAWWAAAAFREGECRERMGEIDEAASLWRELVAKKPGAYEAPLALARLHVLEATASIAPPTVGGIAVQVGAFAQEDNARELAARIREGGFAPVRVVPGEDGLHRVLVGRFASRAEAEGLADSLGVAFGLGYSLAVDRP